MSRLPHTLVLIMKCQLDKWFGNNCFFTQKVECQDCDKPYLAEQAWHNAAQSAGEWLDSRPAYQPGRTAQGNAAHLLRVSEPLCKLAHRLREHRWLDDLRRRARNLEM